MDDPATFAAFDGEAQLARGSLRDVVAAVKRRWDEDPGALVLVFEDASGRQLDFDLRGSLGEVLGRVDPRPARAGRGRPRLGVTSREVTLLPRQWAWLEAQPGSASASLRRLVDAARANETARDRARRAAAATGRVMTALAGNHEHFEEAYRALDAGDRSRFEALSAGWPASVRAYLLDLARDALTAGR